RVGRGGALIDAQLAGGDPDPDDHLVVYREADIRGFIADEIARLGPRAFAGHYDVPLGTVKSWISGRYNPSARQVAAVLTRVPTVDTAACVCALEGCDKPVSRPNASYCTKAHRDAAYRLRKKARATVPAPARRQRLPRRPIPDPFADVACRTCGTVLLGAAALGTCPVCSTTNNKE
ncbi:MAG TPA: hypothetical protein VEH82_05065, partial [Acidimicrobiales bacterium]|nr:hypothetical protein [Acidimicrobiales bacterium]